MAFLDDLQKAVGMFNDSMDQYNTTQAFNQAAQQVDEINSSAMKELDKRAALSQASQTLAQNLLQSNVPVSRIQQAFQAFGPQQLPSAQERIQVGAQSEDPGLVKAGIQEMKSLGQAQQDFALERIKAQRKGRAGSGIEQRSLRGLFERKQRSFNSMTKKVRESLLQVNQGMKALSLKNPVADNAIKTMLAKASGEVGNLTEAEREMFAGNPALWAQAKRLSKKAAVGTLPENDRRLLTEMLNVYKRGNENFIDRAGNRAAGELAAITNLSLEDARKVVMPQLKQSEQVETTQQGGASGSFGGTSNLRKYLGD